MRRATTVLLTVLAALTLAGALSATAVAVPDPVGVVGCATEAPAEVAGLVDPTSPGVPTEVPLAGCLAP